MSDERALRDEVEALPARFLECRMSSHRWKRQGDPMPEGRGLFVIRFRCPECKTKRFDRVTRSGVVYARWYERPEGYDIKGFGNATRRKSIYRKVLIDRVEGTG